MTLEQSQEVERTFHTSFLAEERGRDAGAPLETEPGPVADREYCFHAMSTPLFQFQAGCIESHHVARNGRA